MTTLLGAKTWQNPSAWEDTRSISSEIFGLERFRQHARSLAESQKITQTVIRVEPVIKRLEANAIALRDNYLEISAVVGEGQQVTPAAEWLIDNFHLIEENIRQIRADLPAGFYRQLPKLAEGPLVGHPRIFGIVWAYVAHSDSSFDPASLTEFINEYQTVQPLTIGELWAVAISLRLILIENFRRISELVLKARQQRNAADAFADHVASLEGENAHLGAVFKDRGEPEVTQPFAVQLIQRLRDQTPLSEEVLSWLKTKLVAQGKTLESVVSDEHHLQSTSNVTVRNIVTSLRLISDVNWESWFDTVSIVDKVLRSHPLYGAMDFPSRTLYRTAVEDLARGSTTDEIAVAKAVVAFPEKEPGYHLLGEGRRAFEQSLNFTPSRRQRRPRAIRDAGLKGYLGGIAALATLGGLVGLLPLMFSVPVWVVAVLALVLVLPAVEFGVALVNYINTRVVNPLILPGLALRNGVPSDLRTLVVVPALLTSRDEIAELTERLEVHYLSNSEGDIYFALLTDWVDAATETTSTDEMLLADAEKSLAALNTRHGTDRFMLLHRKRLWNPQQNRWMGWERKRGKLHELNRLLRGADDTSFVLISSPVPQNIKYVITLDADTKLPRDAARRLVGKLAHPLNQAKFDETTQRVVSGYGVFQPRVTPSLPVGRYGSLFQRIYSSARGIDPYAFAVSDVYQDVFAEGSFAGKGIYDVDAFEKALAGRIPENTLLSHDLFEGIFARAGLITDIELVEEYPERYSVAVARQHRWVRGDWQLLPWVFNARAKHIPALGLWKMVDNLRRSLTPIALVGAFFVGWIFLPILPAVEWTVFLLMLGLAPYLIPVVTGHIPRAAPLTANSKMMSFLNDLGHSLAAYAGNLVFLGHHAGVMGDAIIRTLYRLRVSHQNLLEWTTAAQSEASHSQTLEAYYRTMISSLVIGIAALAVGFFKTPAFLFLTAPFAAAWLAAPAVAYWLSQASQLQDELDSSPQDRRALRLVARRTWQFFETFVTAQQNMLPPDNFQEEPKPVVANRTSPTNIGLYFLSVVSARELGWIGLGDAIDRIEQTLATITRMEKYEGHLYNWYDTTDLRPLDPKYVSTVDSGNLAGHLLALATACQNWGLLIADKINILEGLEDVLDLALEDLEAIPDDRRKVRPLRKQMMQQVETLRKSLQKAATEPDAVVMRLIDFAVQASTVQNTASMIVNELGLSSSEPLLRSTQALRNTVESHFKDSSNLPAALKQRLDSAAREARDLALNMKFGFLQDPQRQLLSIGYRVMESMRDESCYDLLASEARLASYIAIAKGDLRTRHWFRLGRTVTAVKGGAALLSWSGSMFEYLMPSLVMRAPTGGLLDQTSRLVVQRQMAYAASHAIPWGISESAFNARDIEFTYQYSNFGVPGLGLKRGLADNLVIAPYATGLAAMVAPRASAANYKRLAKEGARGAYGFYESLDYTALRLRKGETVGIVKAYFAHHQGMSIVALYNAVTNGAMRELFHAEPMVRATELLLQERAPRDVPIATSTTEAASSVGEVRELHANTARVFEGMTDGPPVVHLLSNGQYSVMLTTAGSGYSTWNGISLTRWREDSVSDPWGSYFYLREPRTGQVWSAAYQPLGQEPDSYKVIFSEEKAEFIRSDPNFVTAMECLVSPEDGAEVRRITVTNTSLTVREVELSTYAELVLAPASADNAHPVFSKMFVQTEFAPEHQALLATRRRRTPDDKEIWLAQVMAVQGTATAELQYETDRSEFLGRGNGPRNPAALTGGGSLSKTVGNVLDPIFALRRRVRIPAGRQARFTVWTVAAHSREEVLDLVDRHQHSSAFDRTQMMAWTQAQIQLRHLSIQSEEANLFQTLAGSLIYNNPRLRIPPETVARDLGPQSALWPHSISGDRPILLLRIDDVEDIGIVHQVLKAYEYWRFRGVSLDLVILNDRMSSYVQDLQGEIDAVMRRLVIPNSQGRVFALRADLTAPETLRVLGAVARVVIYGRRGTLSSQLTRLKESPLPAKPRPAAVVQTRSSVDKIPALNFFNGYGGFDAANGEYVIALKAEKMTPAPWVNVIANDSFGFHCAAESSGYTWSGNAKENQLTAWSNDPVRVQPAEVFYVRDEQSGAVYSPTLLPLKSQEGSHLARHGFGYTTYERRVDSLEMVLVQTLAVDKPVKLSRLRIKNTGAVSRSLSVTFYAEWVMGQSAASSAPFLISEAVADTGIIVARNPWKGAGDQVSFADMGGLQTHWTADRREFLGSYGDIAAPQAVVTALKLSNRMGAALDPCCALQMSLTLLPGQSRDVVVSLGTADHAQAATTLAQALRAKPFEEALEAVRALWRGKLGVVAVKTPDPAMDLMLNGWLLYQTLSCRMWARSGFYQASGAYGFRDQLQDGMALLHAAPEITREHLLRAAGRQFVQGDFQHWWLPGTGMGVRTKISDDGSWLGYCTALYAATTGDNGIWDETVGYLEGQTLMPQEHDVFFMPGHSPEVGTIYDHCVRGVESCLRFGVHGLPLMGTGDWNDGMNRIGENGKGESVWLGWLILATLKKLSPVAEKRGDHERILKWNEIAAQLQAALEKEGWDGEWYRRAFFDDGQVLGSKQNDECRIDAIAQSWAVLSGAAPADRARMAMDQSYSQLVDEKAKLQKLFTPPFDKTALEPGYIKAYPPGIRENGGQYTHGVVWSIFAHAQLGDTEHAHKLFSLINPVNHAQSEADVQTYRVEPYVIAADVYSVAPYVGRGGWSWYTGSAAWMYRAGLEAILGITREGRKLRVKPCMPQDWPGFEVQIKFASVDCVIKIGRGDGSTAVDGGVTRIAEGEWIIDLDAITAGHTVTLNLK